METGIFTAHAIFGFHPIYIAEEIVTCIFVITIPKAYKLVMLLLLVAKIVVLQMGTFMRVTFFVTSAAILSALVNLAQVIMGIVFFATGKSNVGLFVPFLVLQVIEVTWRGMITAHVLKRKKQFTKGRKTELAGLFIMCCIGCLFLAGNYMDIGVFSHLGANIGFVFIMNLIEALYLPAPGIQCGFPMTIVSEEEVRYATFWRKMFVFTFCTWMFFGGIIIAAGALGFAMGTFNEMIYFYVTLAALVIFFTGCIGSGFIVLYKDMKKYMPQRNNDEVMENQAVGMQEMVQPSAPVEEEHTRSMEHLTISPN